RRKLTTPLVANFPRPGDRTRVANKGDILKCVRFRTFFLVQNRTKSRKNVQKSAKTCQKATEKTGCLRPIYLNRVKSSGSCQAVSFQISVIRMGEEIGKTKAFLAKAQSSLSTQRVSSLRLCAPWRFGEKPPVFSNLLRNQSSVLIHPPTCNSRTEMAVKGAEPPLSCSSASTASLRVQTIDSTMVVGQAVQPKKPWKAGFKGLTSELNRPV